MRKSGDDPADTSRRVGSLLRLSQLDTALAIDAISHAYGETITQQSRSLLELSSCASSCVASPTTRRRRETRLQP